MVETREVSKERAATVPAEAHAQDQQRREFLKYTFYKVRPEWRMRSQNLRATDKEEFGALLRELVGKTTVRTYTLVGIRGDADFATWVITDALDTLTSIARRVSSTGLGRYLEVPYSYLAMRRKSIYLGGHEHSAQDGSGQPRPPIGSKYLFVYPFTKKREWYSVPFEERQRIMREHFRVGHRFPGVTIHTGYSFGLDDQEFTLAFEADRPEEFLDLVMELRSTEASRYTARETPIFTCVAMEADALMATLGD